MERVPEDILPIIFSYIEPQYKYNLNKVLFSKLYGNINEEKLYGNHSYIRNILRDDLHFIFLNMCSIKWDKWISLKNWRYKNIKFVSFTQYLLHLINFYNADKCKKVYLGYDNIIKKTSKKKNKIFNKDWCR